MATPSANCAQIVRRVNEHPVRKLRADRAQGPSPPHAQVVLGELDDDAVRDDVVHCAAVLDEEDGEARREEERHREVLDHRPGQGAAIATASEVSAT